MAEKISLGKSFQNITTDKSEPTATVNLQQAEGKTSSQK